MINKYRATARMDGEFVIFLIGMRINKPWQIHKWLPVFLSMPRMIRELEQRPELGLLSYETPAAFAAELHKQWPAPLRPTGSAAQAIASPALMRNKKARP